MSDLDDQLRQLAEGRADRTPATGVDHVMAASPRRHIRRWPYVAAAVLVAIAGFGIAWATSDDDGFDTLEAVETTQHIVLEEFGLEIQVPVSWSTTSGASGWRAEGDDGFVELSSQTDAMAGEGDPVVIDGLPGHRRTNPDGTVTIDVSVPRTVVRVLLLGITGSPDDLDAIISSIRWLPLEAPPDAPMEWSTVEANDFGVRIDIPAHWSPIEEGRTWGGEDGWIAVDVLPSVDPDAFLEPAGLTLDEVDVTDSTVMGIPATLVSTREPVELEFGTFPIGGAIIVTPTPVTQHDEAWSQIVIGGSLLQLPAILSSAEWIGPTEPTPTAPEPATVDHPDPDTTYDMVAASADHIDLRREDRTIERLDIAGAEIAFLAGDRNEYLVTETRQPSGATTITIRTADSTTDVDLGVDDFHVAYLLDVATIDGRPTALLDVRINLVGPETTFQEIRVLDLETLDMTTASRENTWEAFYDTGFFADGAVVLGWVSLGDSRIDVLDLDGTERWSVVIPDGIDQPFGAVAADAERAYWLRLEPDPIEADSTLLTLEVYDIETGEYLGDHIRSSADAPRGCGRVEMGRGGVICSSARQGVSFRIDLEFGIATPLDGFDGALITQPRIVGSGFPDRHPCAPFAFAYEPDDFFGFVDIPLDGGGSMGVGWWSPDGERLVLQGFLPDFRTNQVDIGVWDGGPLRIEIEPAADDSPAEGLFTVFIPDESWTEEVPTGLISWYEFDGCDLVAGLSGVVN